MRTKQAIRIAQICRNEVGASKRALRSALREAQEMNVTTFDCLRAGLLLNAAKGNTRTVENHLCADGCRETDCSCHGRVAVIARANQS